MIGYISDTLMKPVAWAIEGDKMERFGIRRTQAWARRYNRLRHGKYQRYRQRLYAEQRDALIAEDGVPVRPTVEMTDGWAIDTSRTAPHLDALIEQAEQVIAERGGDGGRHFGKTFFQDLWEDPDAERYPAVLDFITSPQIVATVADYFRAIPHLAPSRPRGIRLNESWRKYDPDPDGPPKSSQMFHIDIHNCPVVYVIVPVRDVTDESGPFCFYGASDTDRIAGKLRWGERGVPYRLADEEVAAATDGEALHRFTYPKGSILFIDSSACFHYGSRNAVVPRYQYMFAYALPCRSDFSDVRLYQHRYPIRPDDGPLRRLLLDRYVLEAQPEPATT